MCHTRSSCSTLGLDFPTGHEGCVGVVANSSSIHAAIIISSTSQQDILLQRNLASATASWSQPFRKWAFGSRNLNPRLRNCDSMLLKHSDDQTWRPRRGLKKMQNHQKIRAISLKYMFLTSKTSWSNSLGEQTWWDRKAKKAHQAPVATQNDLPLNQSQRIQSQGGRILKIQNKSVSRCPL